MNLKEKAKNLPSSPGVYLMKDAYGSIIYVGKSKCLKNRVQSYLQPSKNHSKKVEKLIHQLKDFDYILTDTEFEAFMLECQLIQQLQPPYNKLMKSPHSYTYIRITADKGFHRMELSNHMNKKDKHAYFGPYTSRSTVEKAILGLKEFFNINCNRSYHQHTPCLNYSLGLCIGMCVNAQAREQYHHIISRITSLLAGTDAGILEEMKQKMTVASESFDFEKAAKIRDTLEAIHTLLKKEKVIKFTRKNKNIVMMEAVDDHRIKVFLVKRNQVLFAKMYEVNDIKLKQLSTEVREKIFTFFPTKATLPPTDILKEELDESQIVYSYLKNSPCEYFIVPKTWLDTKNDQKIDNAINRLLSSMLKLEGSL